METGVRGGVLEGAMPWMAAAELVVLKRPPRVLVALCLRSMVSWAARMVVFHNLQSLAVAARPSQSGHCFGKLPATRREGHAMAASQLSVIERPAQVAFFYKSSIVLMYSGTRGSAFQKSIISFMRETMLVASKPPLPKAIWSRIWRRVILL